MFRLFTLFVVAAAAVARPDPKIMEADLTQLFQAVLAPYDPKLVPSLENLNIVTDHGSFLFNATDVTVAGFGLIEVTNFVPPIPLLSKHVKLSLKVGLLTMATPNYSLVGSHEGTHVEPSGTGDLEFTDFELTIDFKADSYAMEPISICMQPGSFSIDLAVLKIESNLEGAGEINDDINTEGPALLDGVEAQINEQSGVLEDMVNSALCVQRF